MLVKVPERLEGDGGWGRWELVWDVTLAISGSNRESWLPSFGSLALRLSMLMRLGMEIDGCVLPGPFHEEVEIPNSRLWTILDSMVGGYGVGRGEVVVVRTGW